MKMWEYEYFSCDCGTPDHIFRIMYFTDSKEAEDDYLFCSVHLTRGSFWRRLKNGLRYIFGFDSRYGQWDEVLLGKEEALRLRNVCDKFLERYKNE